VVGRQGIIEAVRLIIAACITGLSATGSHNPVIIAVSAGASVLATHVVPAVTQKGTIMSMPSGQELMGLVRPVETAVEPAVPAVETAAEATEEAVKLPTTENVETAVEDAVPAVEAAVKAAPDAAQALRDAADSLRKVADSLV
jgi:nucleotide-binding universal stress UspA family protein